MSNNRRIRRKYTIKDDNLIRYIVSSLRSIPQDVVIKNLDDYERHSIARPSHWARNASEAEIMCILAKLGIKLTLIGMDERNPVRAYQIAKAVKEYYRTKNLNGLLDTMTNHKFFSLAGASVIKNLDLCSQLASNGIFIPNKDFATFLKIGTDQEKATTREIKSIDGVLGSVCIMNGVDDLTLDDLAILYLIRKYDELPLSSLRIYETLEYKRTYRNIQRHISYLVKSKYLVRRGAKKNSTYSLSERGRLALSKARKLFFEDTKFMVA